MAQLQFQKVDYRGEALGSPMIVKYAPSDMSFTKAVTFAEVAIPGLDQPLTQFIRGNAETLTLELFFDHADAAARQSTGTGAARPQTVSDQMLEFHNMLTVSGKLRAPPLVRVSWGGTFPAFPVGQRQEPAKDFTAVVLSVGRKITLFSQQGEPLRAVVTVALRHYATARDQAAEINFSSPNQTRQHTVTEGETLPQIAYEAYSDPTKWRDIASANNLADAQTLTPGTVLTLPPIGGL